MDTLLFDPEAFALTDRRVPFAVVRSLQTYAGHESGLWRVRRWSSQGGEIGGVLGLTVGFMRVLADSSLLASCIASPHTNCELTLMTPVAYALIGGVSGIVLSGILAAVTSGDRWKSVDLPRRAGFDLGKSC